MVATRVISSARCDFSRGLPSRGNEGIGLWSMDREMDRYSRKSDGIGEVDWEEWNGLEEVRGCLKVNCGM